MYLSNYQRLRRVIINLIKNPDLITRYFQHNILNNKLPIDIKLPWWSYRSIQYVDTIVQGKRIFEFGTGGSTIHFAKRANSIMAVEDNVNWAELVRKRLQVENINNVEVIDCPFDFYNPVDFEYSKYLKMVDTNDFDIIIIDGQDHTFNERIKCFRYIEPRLKSGQYIIVDDFWRYNELISSNKAKSVKVFESVGPCRFGVTSTAVFSY